MSLFEMSNIVYWADCLYAVDDIRSPMKINLIQRAVFPSALHDIRSPIQNHVVVTTETVLSTQFLHKKTRKNCPFKRNIGQKLDIRSFLKKK